MNRQASFERWLRTTRMLFVVLVAALVCVYGYTWWYGVRNLGPVELERQATRYAECQKLSDMATFLERVAKTLPADVRCERVEYRIGEPYTLTVQAYAIAALYEWCHHIKNDSALDVSLTHIEQLPSGMYTGIMRCRIVSK